MSKILLTFIFIFFAGSIAHASDSKDVLAVQRYGNGSGTVLRIHTGERVTAGDTPTLIEFEDAPRSTAILAPGSALHLERRSGANGPSLMVCLDAGTVEVSISDKGVYEDVHVLGSAVDVRVTGTLFIVERVKRDTDYVALVRGKLSVRLRQEVAEVVAAGASDHVDLDARQGVEGSAAGLSKIDSMSSRPQLATSSSSMKASIKEQGQAPAGANGGAWDSDEVAAAIAAALASAGISGPISSAFAQEVADQVAASIGAEVDAQMVQDIVNANLTPLPELGGPPGHP